jgi:hypothetical protein
MTRNVSVTTSVMPLTMEEYVAALEDHDTLFYMESGVTSHCSPVHTDFVELAPIKAHDIKGMSSTCISAISRGTINLKCLKGKNLILRDILYIPQAMLHLISIGWPTDENLDSTLSKYKCVIQKSSGKIVASGTRKGRELYIFNGALTVIKHAHIMRATPNLEMWHKRLSHINYASIILMSKDQLASGMPVDLSALPRICEHCVIAKQTKTPVPKMREGEWAKERLAKVSSDIMALIAKCKTRR